MDKNIQSQLIVQVAELQGQLKGVTESMVILSQMASSVAVLSADRDRHEKKLGEVDKVMSGLGSQANANLSMQVSIDQKFRVIEAAVSKVTDKLSNEVGELYDKIDSVRLELSKGTTDDGLGKTLDQLQKDSEAFKAHMTEMKLWKEQQEKHSSIWETRKWSIVIAILSIIGALMVAVLGPSIVALLKKL